MKNFLYFFSIITIGLVWPVNEFALRIIKEALSSPRTFKELLILTGLPERTLRYNLSILKKQGLVKEIIIFKDLRRKIFALSEGEINGRTKSFNKRRDSIL
jgi:DNA-binding transcriptional ArsR family regulator